MQTLLVVTFCIAFILQVGCQTRTLWLIETDSATSISTEWGNGSRGGAKTTGLSVQHDGGQCGQASNLQ